LTESNFLSVADKGEQIGTVTFRPNHVLSLRTTEPIEAIVWPQRELHLTVQLKQMTLPIQKDDILGTVTLDGETPQKVTVAAAQSMSAPALPVPSRLR